MATTSMSSDLMAARKAREPMPFKRIGAGKTAAICKKALKALGQALPRDWEERRALLDKIVDDRVGELLEACDEAFYEYPDDLEALNVAYVKKNAEHFDLMI